MPTAGMQNSFIKRLMDAMKLKGCYDISDVTARLSHICGVTPPAVRAWLKGTIPKVEYLVQIADYLNLTLDELVGRTVESTGAISVETNKGRQDRSCTLFIPRSLVELLWGPQCDLDRVSLWMIPHDIPCLGRRGDFALVEKIPEHAAVSDMAWCLFTVRGQNVVRRIRLSVEDHLTGEELQPTNEYVALAGLSADHTQMVGKIIATIRVQT